MSDPTLLLTGALGGVARMVRPLLLARYGALRLSDRAASEGVELAEGETYEQAELADAARLTEITRGVDGVIHLGGQSVEADWPTVMESNVQGLVNLFEACRANGVKRLIFASSNHAVGFYARTRRIGVDERVRPDSRYGVSKAFGEALGSLYADKFGMRILNIRIGNVAERPIDRRRLAIWIHPDDLMRLFVIGLEHSDLHCETVYGMSHNERAWWDNMAAYRLGYRPAHAAEDHAVHALAEQARLAPDPLGDRLQGGTFCSDEFAGEEDRFLA